MQHQQRSARFGRSWLLATSLASGFAAAGCDGSDPSSLAPAEPSAARVPEPDIAGFSAVGPCAMELPACDGSSSGACTLTCGTRPDGCVAYSEFVPLGANHDETYALRWGPIAPDGRWAIYRRELSRGRREATLYHWSVERGDVALADLLGLPPTSAEVHEALIVAEVGAAGDAILLLGFDDEVLNHGYVWTREAGLARLDFVPYDMSADGRVVVGARAGRAVVWSREAGLRRLDGAPLETASMLLPDAVPDAETRLGSVRWIRVSDSGELVLSVENSGRGFRWGEGLGSVALDGLPGFPQRASVDLADLESGVIVASTPRSEREPLRLWWWGDSVGAREIGTLPDESSSFRRSASLLRAGGQVIVGDESGSYGEVAVFRWSSALGTERVSPPGTLSLPQYVNAEGSTIVGTAAVGVQVDTFRWSAQSGMSLIPEAGGTSLIALGGDVLVAPTGDGEPARYRVLKFDRALQPGEALPIDLIAAGLVADHDAYEQTVHLVSENARLLVGTLRDYRGVSRAWALRLRDTCDPS